MILRLFEEDLYTSQLYKSELNPDGIGSSQTIKKIIGFFEKMKIVERYEDPPGPRIYLRLTKRGRRIAEHLRTIEEILQSP